MTNQVRCSVGLDLVSLSVSYLGSLKCETQCSQCDIYLVPTELEGLSLGVFDPLFFKLIHLSIS